MANKPEWTEAYNCYRLEIGAILCSVNWSTDRNNPGYSVSVMGSSRRIKLKNNVRDIDTGKQEALRLAKKLIAITQEELALYEQGVEP